MNNMKEYSESFKFSYEKFTIGCAAVVEMGMWDQEQYGDMITYYDNDIISIILQLIAADGKISNAEVKNLDELFGFTYELEELTEMFKLCKDNVDNLFLNGVCEAYQLLKRKNETLAENYKELLELVIKMAMESDGVILNAEKEMALKLKDIITSAE